MSAGKGGARARSLAAWRGRASAGCGAPWPGPARARAGQGDAYHAMHLLGLRREPCGAAPRSIGAACGVRAPGGLRVACNLSPGRLGRLPPPQGADAPRRMRRPACMHAYNASGARGRGAAPRAALRGAVLGARSRPVSARTPSLRKKTPSLVSWYVGRTSACATATIMAIMATLATARSPAMAPALGKGRSRAAGRHLETFWGGRAAGDVTKHLYSTCLTVCLGANANEDEKERTSCRVVTSLLRNISLFSLLRPTPGALRSCVATIIRMTLLECFWSHSEDGLWPRRNSPRAKIAAEV